jgi:hypothetical protein
LLPANFEQIDAVSEGLSKESLGLGSNFAETEAFLSEEPYQLIYGILGILESRLQQAGENAIMKDKQQFESMVIASLKEGATEAGVVFDVPKVDITYPDIGDLAVLGEGQISTTGLLYGFDMIEFHCDKVYIVICSLYFTSEKQSLVPIAREITHRIGMLTQ